MATTRFGAISSARLNNFTAGATPAVTDDSNSGYSPGSLWMYANNMYMCIDATVGAAVWKLITPGSFAAPGSFSPSMATVIPRPIIGSEIPNNVTLLTTSGLVAMIELQAAIDVVRISVDVATQGTNGAVARVAIYSFDGATKLIDLAIDVTVTNGLRSATLTLKRLAAGYYWALMCRGDTGGGTNPIVRDIQTGSGSGTAMGPTGSNVDTHGSLTVTNGAAPSTIDPTSLTAASHLPWFRLDNA
jgi:hypothetical protein